MRRLFFFVSLAISLALPAGFSFAQTVGECTTRATVADTSCKQQVELQVALTCGEPGEVDEACAERTRTNGLAVCASRLDTALEACLASADMCTQRGESVYRDCINAESTTSVAQCEALRDQTVRACNIAGATATTPEAESTVQATTPRQTSQQATRQSAFARTYDQVMSQGIIFANICDSRTAPCDCRDSGDCAISDILQVAVNVVNFIIAISGSLVLAMFIYGGVLWIFSAGNEGMVKQGQDIIEGAVIGLIIILGSYAAVAIIVSILTKDEAVRDGTNLEDLTGGSQIFNTENP